MYRFEIFAFEKYIGYRDVEIQVRITQSLKMALFDRSHMISY